MLYTTKQIIERIEKEIDFVCHGYTIVVGNREIFKIDRDTDTVYRYMPLEFLQYMRKDWINEEHLENLIEGKENYNSLHDYIASLKESMVLMNDLELEIERLVKEGVR